MKTRHVTLTAGRPKDLAEQSPGYSASGEGQFSRVMARGIDPTPKMAHRVSRTRGPGRSLDQLIAETQGGIHFLEAQLRVEDSPIRVEKLQRNLELKTSFIEKLRREQTAVS